MLYSGFIETLRGQMYLGRSPFLSELQGRMEESRDCLIDAAVW